MNGNCYWRYCRHEGIVTGGIVDMEELFTQISLPHQTCRCLNQSWLYITNLDKSQHSSPNEVSSDKIKYIIVCLKGKKVSCD